MSSIYSNIPRQNSEIISISIIDIQMNLVRRAAVSGGPRKRATGTIPLLVSGLDLWNGAGVDRAPATDPTRQSLLPFNVWFNLSKSDGVSGSEIPSISLENRAS